MTHSNAVLIPELAFEIQQHLLPHDLAAATRVNKAWNEAWTPFLYHSVKFNGRGPSAHSLPSTRMSSPQPVRRPRSFSQHYHQSHPPSHQHHHHQLLQPPPPFLNLEKYGHWIKSLQASNLFLDPTEHLSTSSPRPSNSSHSRSLSTSCSSSSSSFTPPVTSTLSSLQTTSASPSSPVISDHLLLIKNCKTLALTQLDIQNTVMSLERLDELLSGLPQLKVFKFEVMNQIDNSSLTASNLLAFDSSGFRYRQGVHKTWMDSLLGLEPEVIRVIAKRLSPRLERLELSFALPATISLAVFDELLKSCRSTLKALVLSKAEICQINHSRVESHSHQMQIEALLANLWETSISSVELNSASLPEFGTESGPQQLQQQQHTTRSWMSSSTSSSSLSSSYSTGASSISSEADNLLSLKQSAYTGPPVLESLSFFTCAIPNKEFDWFLSRTPALKDLTIHNCDALGYPIVASMQHRTPLLESISLCSIPGLSKRGLKSIFEPYLPDPTKITLDTTSNEIPMQKLQFKSIRLAYLRQLEDSVMESIATHQGNTLTRLSVHWCPHVTDYGVQPIFNSCEKLEELSLYLTKPTLASIRKTDGQKPWACTQTLRSLELGGPMFVDQLRQSNEYLHPQLYHHTSSNPHQSYTGNRTRALSASSSFTPTYGHRSTSIGACFSNGGTSASNIIQNTYSVAHHQGYPMYHLLRYQQLGNPLKELRERMETLPRLTHLGIQSKGIEHLIRQGFGPNVRIRSLTLLNQHGRVWAVQEVKELLENMPSLMRLQCDRNTIMPDTSPATNGGVDQREEMRQLLEARNVELFFQTTPSARVL
ncbi:hypothetical protein BGZ94_002028 [Podila epigama]|nr:hypothetical protein BGZ94_002028 [Podila epigama]